MKTSICLLASKLCCWKHGKLCSWKLEPSLNNFTMKPCFSVFLPPSPNFCVWCDIWIAFAVEQRLLAPGTKRCIWQRWMTEKLILSMQVGGEDWLSRWVQTESSLPNRCMETLQQEGIWEAVLIFHAKHLCKIQHVVECENKYRLKPGYLHEIFMFMYVAYMFPWDKGWYFF